MFPLHTDPLPSVVRPLAGDGPVGEVDPGALPQLLGAGLVVLADTGALLLEDEGDAWIRQYQLN